jgi:hypothetical protein
MRWLLALVALAAFALAAVVSGAGLEARASEQTAAGAAQSLRLGDLRVQRRAPGGRVRGSLAAAPAGAALEIVVRRGARPAGRRTVTAAASGRTRFSVRLDRASRARLRRAGHLDVRVDVTASGAGTRVSTGTTARVTR